MKGVVVALLSATYSMLKSWLKMATSSAAIATIAPASITAAAERRRPGSAPDTLASRSPS